jgi:hypothetical protein
MKTRRINRRSSIRPAKSSRRGRRAIGAALSAASATAYFSGTGFADTYYTWVERIGCFLAGKRRAVMWACRGQLSILIDNPPAHVAAILPIPILPSTSIGIVTINLV